MADDQKFSVFDYIIFGLLLTISAAIGIIFGCFGKKQKTSKDILIANRQMGLLPSSMSLLASFMSGITLLGNPSEVYNYGTMFWWSGVAYTLVTIVTSKVFIPLFLHLEVTSAYEYLEKRFNRNVKLLASCVFIFQMTIYMALVLYAPALALNQVTKINTWISIVSIGVVCTFYTTIGGMKAVMWTDVFQILIMFIGLLAALIKGVMDVGGVRKVIETNWKYDRIEFFVFDFDPTVRHTVWGLTIGSFFQWLSIYGVNQSQVQRYLSVPSIKIAKKAIYYNLIGLWIILSLTLSIGLVVFAKYQDCDPILNEEVKTGEQLFPLFVMQTLKSTPGLPGLFLACLFSAALSTISSGLNSLAAVTLEDVIKGFIVKDLDEKKAARLSKILCIVYGMICLLFTYFVSFLGALLQAALSLFGIIGGPILGLFCLGIFIPFSNSKGAFIGTLIGLSFMIWIFTGFNVYGIKYPKKEFFTYGCNITLNTTLEYTFTTEKYTSNFQPYISDESEHKKSGLEIFHSISYTWYGSLAVLTVCISGSIISLLTGITKPGKVDPKLMISLVDKLLPCIPKKIRKFFNCGYNYESKMFNVQSKAELIESPNFDIQDDLQLDRIEITNL